MGKLLKKIIWDFHTKNLIERAGGSTSLQGEQDICEVLCDTLLLVVVCFIAYAVIVGIPLYLISGWVLYFFVGMGEMLYVDITVDFLISVCILVVAAAIGYLVAKLLMFTCQGLVYLCTKVILPKFDLKSKVCFKVDFKDMED
jgi:hypothetical protein